MGLTEEIFATIKEVLEKPGQPDLQYDLPMDGGQLGPVREVLRTPDECFAELPDFPFEPHYFETKGHGRVRIAYIDEGPRDAPETIFLQHGMPCWSYIYRHMIPPLVRAGYRVIAPDLVGFGRSDKPVLRSDHSFERHVDWLSELVLGLDIDNATAFLHDWGGMCMLRVIARYPERFLRVALGNTGLMTGGGAAPIFKVWAGYLSQKLPLWGPFIDASSEKDLSPEEVAAYDAPFPSEAYRLGTRQLPQLVAVYEGCPSVEENKGAWRRVYERWQKPFITMFPPASGEEDNAGGSTPWKTKVPGAQGQAHHVLETAKHYIQEGSSEEIVEHLLKFIQDNPMPLNATTAVVAPADC